VPTVIEIVFTVTLFILLATGLLIAFALVRRKQRAREFREIDELRRLSFPIISSLAAGKLDYAPALRALREVFASGLNRAQLVERVLFDGRSPKTIPVPVLRQLAVDFGLVELWERRLLGHFEPVNLRHAVSRPDSALERVRPLSFLLRARSAERLGLICHSPSWQVLVRALDDPHTDVRSAAARALGAIAEPHSFPALVERLQAVVLAPSASLSVRHVKAVLVSFPLPHARELAGSLAHTHPRVRFLAADVVREMVERCGGGEAGPVLRGEELGPELAELFLTRLVFDENPDVRARVAPVIARLDDPRVVLRLAVLLDDVKWFVRLHAVRALAQAKLVALADHVTLRLTDVNWRVREAAVRTLLSFGTAGVERLVGHFFSTQDRYSLEQIAEELQRAGLLHVLLGKYRHDDDGRRREVIERLAGMGKSNCLLAVLESGPGYRLGEQLLEELAPGPESEIRMPMEKATTVG
jgi:HEAT repeat protein